MPLRVVKFIGCEADAVPHSTTNESISSNAGGTVETTANDSTITVTAPENFTGAAGTVVIQIKPIEASEVFGSIGYASSTRREVGTGVFDVKAIINNATILDSFDAPITIEYEYDEKDIGGLDESTFWLYHYHDDVWEALDECVLDTGANTISCTTESFSIFALFGEPVSRTRAGGTFVHSSYGCADPAALNFQASAIHMQSWCLYPEKPQVTTVSETVTLPQPSVLEPVSIFSKDLKLGMTDGQVLKLQQTLNACGFIVAQTGAGSNGKETNLFGALTRQALIKFQIARKINPVDGTLNAVTRLQLNKEKCQVKKPVPIKPSSPMKDVRDLYVGLRGEDVRALQTILISQQVGTKALELKRVTATGFFSSYTHNALIEYQTKYDIQPSNGYFGIKTREQMKKASIKNIWW